MIVGDLTAVLNVDSDRFDRELRASGQRAVQVASSAGDGVAGGIAGGFDTGSLSVADFSSKLHGVGMAAAASVASFFVATGAALALVGAIGGIGIAAIATTDEMKKVFEDTKKHIVDSVRKIAEPFKAVLLNLNHHFRYAFDEILPVLGRMMQAVAPLVNMFGQELASAIGNFVKALEPAVNAALPTFLAVAKALQPLLTSLGNTFTNLVTPLAGFGHQTTAVFVNMGRLFEAVGRLIGVLAPLGAMILNAVLPVMTTLVDTLATALMPVVKALEPVLASIGLLLNGVAVALGPVIEAWGRLIAGALTVVSPLLNAIALQIVAVVNALSPLFVALLNIATMALPLLNPLIALLVEYLNKATDVVNTRIAPAIASFADMLTQKAIVAINWLKETIRTAWADSATVTDDKWGRIKWTIKTVLDEIWAKAKEIWETHILPFLQRKWEEIKQKAEEIWNNQIKPALARAMDRIKEEVKRKAVELVLGLIQELLTAPAKAAMAMVRVQAAVIGAFAGAGRWLFDAGARIIGGLISGVTSKIGELTSKLGGITRLIPKWKGPAVLDARLLMPSGQLIMAGLIQGITGSLPHLRALLGDVTRMIPATLGANVTGLLDAPVLGAPRSAPTGAAAAVYNINFGGPVYADSAGIRRLAVQLGPELQRRDRSHARSNAGSAGDTRF